MRYWWVNQNQTYKHEVSGGYIWSPQRKKNGTRNPFYETMREVTPGDLILSFRDTKIGAVGRATSTCYLCPKPSEFGLVGRLWTDEHGLRVDVMFTQLASPIRPTEHMEVLRPLLPAKYSPLRPTGAGQQQVYLAELPVELAEALINLITGKGNAIPPDSVIVDSREEEIRHQLEDLEDQRLLGDKQIPETERQELIKARRGQGRFRQNVLKVEEKCRITGVSNPDFLIAGHIKPWRYSNNEERLSGYNGFMLAPHVDLLFDRGFISFGDDGSLVISPAMDRGVLSRLGIRGDTNVGGFKLEQLQFLKYHREHMLKKRSKH